MVARHALRHRARAIAVGSLLLLTAAPGSAQRWSQQLAAVPEVSFDTMEPAVAEQLTVLLRDAAEARQAALHEGGDGDASASPRRDAASAFGRLAMALHAYEVHAAALVAYDNAALADPTQSDWYHGAGLVQRSRGELEGAASSFRRALELEPDREASRVHLGEVLIELGRLDEADQVLSVGEDTPSAHPSRLAALGQLALARNEPVHAIAMLELALDRLPEAGALHYPLALAYRKLGDGERARDHLARRGAVGVKPPDRLAEQLDRLKAGERVFLLQGRRAFRVGRFQEAADAFRRATEADSTSARALINLSAALDGLDRPEEAAAALDRALEIEPENLAALYNRGALHLARGEHARAVARLRPVVAASPRDGEEAAAALTRALRALGQTEDALAVAEEAAQASDSASVLFLRSALLVELERFEEAKAALDLAHALHPTDPQIVYGLARLLAASPRRDLREPERALELAAGMFDALPSASSAELVATALAMLGRCTEAADKLREAARLSGDGAASALLARAEAYRRDGACSDETN